MLTRKRLTEQLRYGGVLEAVRVARLEYPVRLDHTSFFKRYRMLLPSVRDDDLPWSIKDYEEPKKLCVNFLKFLATTTPRANRIRMAQGQPEPIVFPKSDVQVGLTKVFMRNDPHVTLESHRVSHRNASVTLIQSWMRGLHARTYLTKSDAALTIERWYQDCLVRAR